MRLRQSLLVLLLAATSFAVFAQEAPSPDASPVSNAPDTSQPEDRATTTLKVNVNLVSLYFTVHDKRGGLIPNLTKDDCSILEDKTPRNPTCRSPSASCSTLAEASRMFFLWSSRQAAPS
jgi:hypothetical protein